MKKFTLGFFLGLVVMFGVGAATDDSIRKIADAVNRIAHSVEIIAKQRQS
jgi:CHASE3 domain sensor protein